jgi:hypothetical protein
MRSLGLIPQIAFERHDGSWCHITKRKLRRISYLYDEEEYTGKAVLIKEDAATAKAIQYLEQRGITPQRLSCRLEEAAVHHLVQSSLVDYLKRAIARIAFNYLVRTENCAKIEQFPPSSRGWEGCPQKVCQQPGAFWEIMP